MNSRVLATGCIAFMSVVLVSAQVTGPAGQTPAAPPRPAPAPAARPAPVVQPAAARASVQAPGAEAHRATLDKYCVTCHNEKLNTANLKLDKLDLATSRPGDWRKSCPEIAGGDDAAIRDAASRSRDAREPHWLVEGELDRERGNASAAAWPSPPESHRVRERDSRPARPRSRSDQVPAVGRFDAMASTTWLER